MFLVVLKLTELLYLSVNHGLPGRQFLLSSFLYNVFFLHVNPQLLLGESFDTRLFLHFTFLE